MSRSAGSSGRALSKAGNVPEVLKDHAEMSPVLERPLESNEMLLVVRIRRSKLVEDLNFLETGLVHRLLASDDLDSDVDAERLVRAGLEHPSLDDSGEHAFAKGGVDLVPAVVDDLSRRDAVVAVGIVPVVGQRRSRG